MSALIFPVCLQPYFGSHSINAQYVPEDSLFRKAATIIPIIGAIIGLINQLSLLNQARQAENNREVPRLIRLLEINNQYIACQITNTALMICLFVSLKIFSYTLFTILVGCLSFYVYDLITFVERRNIL